MAPSIDFDTVADLYDAYVRVDFDLPFFREEAKRARGKVLELTSGTGRVSIPLLQDGIDLTCVDYSGRMLAVLRRKLRERHLACRIILADMAEFSIDDRFDLIFIPFHSLSETLDRSRHESILARVRAHLADTGVFICTLQNPAVRTKLLDGTTRLVGEFAVDSGGTLVVRSALTYDPVSQIASGRQTLDLLDAEGNILNARRLDMRFYLFSREEFTRLAGVAGFEITDLYGDYDRSTFNDARSPYMIWKMKKCASPSC